MADGRVIGGPIQGGPRLVELPVRRRGANRLLAGDTEAASDAPRLLDGAVRLAVLAALHVWLRWERAG